MGLATKDLSRPLTTKEQDNVAHLDRLKYFLATAPSRWSSSGSSRSADDTLGDPGSVAHTSSHPSMNRFLLPSSEYVSCILWGGIFHITGTDIVRALVFRFEAFGRPVRNMKKFEEGVFSDLRNLKPGVDATLEEPKSPFLDLLFKYQCIRTQKKQKVFYWYSVPHDRLFLDALERDLKREKMGLEPTTVVVGEPALSFTYEPQRSLYEQFGKVLGGREADGDSSSYLTHDVAVSPPTDDGNVHLSTAAPAASQHNIIRIEGTGTSQLSSAVQRSSLPFMPFTLFEGSPTYKQRRKKPASKFHPGNLSGVNRSSPDGGHHSRNDTTSVGNGYGLGDRTSSAADMFIAQARGDSRVIPGTPPADINLPQLSPALSVDSGVYGTYNHAACDDSAQRLSHTYSCPPDNTTPPTYSHGTNSSGSGSQITSKAFVCPAAPGTLTSNWSAAASNPALSPYYSQNVPEAVDVPSPDGDLPPLGFLPPVDASNMTWASLSHVPSPPDSISSHCREPMMASLTAPPCRPEYDDGSLHRSMMTRSVAGPVRRHRSMTPSLLRGFDRGQSPPSRGYHPYPTVSATQSRASSSGTSSPSSLACSPDMPAMSPVSIGDHSGNAQTHCVPATSQLPIGYDVVSSGMMSYYDSPLETDHAYSSTYFDSNPLLTSA